MKSLMKAAAVVALVAGAGCASYAGTGGGGSSGYVTRSGLRAMIIPTSVGYGDAISFQVNRPAYTALFRIIPGYGASMIYPRPGFGDRQGFVNSGMHRVIDGLWSSRGLLAQSRWDMNSMGSRYSGGAYDNSLGMSEPEFYLLVASDEPLQLDRTGLYGFSNNFVTRYYGSSGYMAMEQLVSEIVPDPSSDSYTTDYYIHWPNYISSTPQSGLVQVECNGRRMYVNPANIERAMAVLCRPQTQQPGQNPPTSPADSTGIIEPRRRAPVPAETVSARDRISSTQLQDPEVFEAARRAAEAGREIDLDEGVSPVNAGRTRRPMDDDFGGRPSVFDDPDMQPGRRRPAPDDSYNPPPQARPEPRQEPRERPTFDDPPPSRPESRPEPPPPPPSPSSDDGAGEPRQRPEF